MTFPINTMLVGGTVVRSFVNDQLTFAAATVKILSAAGTVFIDIVAFEEPLITQISELQEGQFIHAVAAPQAKKVEQDDGPTVWQTRWVASEIQVAQQSLLALAPA